MKRRFCLLSGVVPALLLTGLLAACGDDQSLVTAAGIEITPREISFQQVILNEATSQSVTIRSTGTATLVLDALFIDANTADLRADFNFPGRVELLPGDELVVSVVYEPTEVLQATGDLVIGTNVRFNEEVRVPLVTPPLTPQIVVLPSPIDFGGVSEGSVNMREITLTNRGTAPAIITDIFLRGSSDFDIPALDDETFPITLDVFVADDLSRQDSLVYDMSYTPLTPGSDEGTLVVEYNTRTGETQVDVRGQVGPSILTCAPNPINFGASSLSIGKRLTVTCTNNGQQPIDLDMLSFNPELSPNYAFVNLPGVLATEDGSLALPVGTSFPFVVEYTPPAERSDLQQIFIDYTINGESDIEILTVTGVGVDNRCPIVVPRGFIQGDPNQRRSNEIDWATPTDTLILDGTGSSDPDGTIIAWEWSISRTPQGATTPLRPLDGSPDDTARRQYFLPLQGRYEFTLRVTDDVGFQDCDQPGTVTVIALPDEAIHIELTWTNPLDPNESDDQGSDVDLHFVKMPANWFSDFDTYFANDEPQWQPELPSLDIDDTDGAGPENIQMDDPVDCQWYAVGAHYFEQEFGTAYVTIRVFVEAEQVAEFLNRPMRVTDDFWDIGRLHWPTGEFFAVDEVYHAFDSSSATPPTLTPQMVQSIANTGICN